MGRRPTLHQRTRLAWLWLAAAAVERIIGGIAYHPYGDTTFPGPGSVLRMLLIPFVLAGPFCLSREGGRLEWQKMLLDLGGVLAGGAMVM